MSDPDTIRGISQDLSDKDFASVSSIRKIEPHDAMRSGLLEGAAAIATLIATGLQVAEFVQIIKNRLRAAKAIKIVNDSTSVTLTIDEATDDSIASAIKYVTGQSG